MNKERLEMMRVMLERVVAGSWRPTNDVQTLKCEFLGVESLVTAIDDKIAVHGLELSTWTSRKNHGYASNGCGFTACAVGHACFDDQFRELGLKWDNNKPKYEGYTNWSAVSKFFGISSETADLLFHDGSYQHNVVVRYEHLDKNVRQAKMVADRVAELMTLGESKLLAKYL